MKSMPWFKVYTEARTDKKLSSLTLAERGVWINLLMYAAEQDEDNRGAFDASDREILAIECAEGDAKVLDRTIKKLQQSKHLICCQEHAGYLIFRTFAERQARKPSDEKPEQNERQRRSRASRAGHMLSRPVTRDIAKNANVTRLEEDEEEREILRNPRFSSSGEVNLIIADDAATASAARDESSWTELEARRVGKKIIPILKLPVSAIDGLMAILQQYPYAPPYLESEAHTCAEWCREKQRRTSLRIFSNWLKEGASRREQQLASMNGNGNGKAATNHATHEQQQQPGTSRANGVYDPEKDEAFMERRAAARLVRNLGQQQTS